MPNGPPRPSDLINSLLPGDQLLEVNGRLVNEMTCDELIQEIEECGQQILVKVRAMPELAEFCCQQTNGVINCENNQNNSLQFNAINSGDSLSEVCFFIFFIIKINSFFFL